MILGSYAGNLAIAMRVKHPETFYGAVASGPITEVWGPSAHAKDKFGSAI